MLHELELESDLKKSGGGGGVTVELSRQQRDMGVWVL